MAVVSATLLCGCAATGSPASPIPASSSADPGPSSPTNKELASAEAERLLALAELPPGAVPLDAAPARLQAGPIVGTPGTSSFLDHARYWRVPMSLTAAMAWFRAHAPAGLTEGGSASGGDPDDQTAGVSYSAPDSPAWRDAAFDVGIAAEKSSPDVSDVRIDGVADWLDPVPLKDAATGPRLRVTVGGPCPTTDRRDVGVSNPSDDLSAALLPDGVPTRALVCSYVGLNGNTFSLSRSTAVEGSQAARLAAGLTAIPLAHLDDVVRSCPMDDGSATVIAFSYAGRDDVDIWYHSMGCRSVSNGYIYADASEAFMTLMEPYTAR